MPWTLFEENLHPTGQWIWSYILVSHEKMRVQRVYMENWLKTGSVIYTPSQNSIRGGKN